MHELGEYSASQAVVHSAQLFGAKNGFIVRSSSAQRWHRRLGAPDFPFKDNRPCFLGSGKIANAELADCDSCVLGFLDRGFLQVQADFGLDL